MDNRIPITYLGKQFNINHVIHEKGVSKLFCATSLTN